MRLIRVGLLVAIAASVSACATVTRGTKDAWSVSSEPSGARVETSNGYFCPATPCAIKIPRKAQFVATVTKAGYKNATITVSNKVSGAGGAGMAGNIILGGLIGAAVDGGSGAMLDLVPNPAFVKLEPEAAPVAVVATAPAPSVAPAPVAATTTATPAPQVAAVAAPVPTAPTAPAVQETSAASHAAAEPKQQSNPAKKSCGGLRVVGDPDALRCN